MVLLSRMGKGGGFSSVLGTQKSPQRLLQLHLPTAVGVEEAGSRRYSYPCRMFLHPLWEILAPPLYACLRR